MNITTQYIDLNSGKVFVKIWTPESIENKAPIVLLHDSLGSVNQWKDFPLQLATKLSRQVIAYDRLGFGSSDAREQLPSLNFIEEEGLVYFPQIKAKLGLTEYLVLGHSVGGAMAINVAAQDKECLSIITIAAQAFVEDLTISGIEQAKSVFQQPQHFEKLVKWHGDKTRWVIDAWTEVWLNPEFRTWQLTVASKITCPVLALHGEKDEYGSVAFPSYIVEQSTGQAQLNIIQSCGHMPHKTHTKQVLLAIDDFINDLS